MDPHTGAAKERFEFPFSDSLPPRSYTQLNTAADPTTGAWAAGMLFGAEWWVTDSKGRLSARRLIHRPAYRVSAATITVGNTTMPDPSARPTEIRYGVRSMTFDEEGIWILTGGGLGSTKAPNDILDVYDRGGEYLHSYRLPFDASNHAKWRRRLYLLRLDPYPQLVALELRRPAN